MGCSYLFYEMCVTSLHLVVLDTFLCGFGLQTIYNVFFQACNLLRPNNLAGELTDDRVNNFTSFFE